MKYMNYAGVQILQVNNKTQFGTILKVYNYAGVLIFKCPY